jgi:hypothetical protein
MNPTAMLTNPTSFYLSRFTDTELASLLLAVHGPWRDAAPKLAEVLYAAAVDEGARRQQPQPQEPEPLALGCADWHPAELADALEVLNVGTYLGEHEALGAMCDAALCQIVPVVVAMLRGATAVHRGGGNAGQNAN